MPSLLSLAANTLIVMHIMLVSLSNASISSSSSSSPSIAVSSASGSPAADSRFLQRLSRGKSRRQEPGTESGRDSDRRRAHFHSPWTLAKYPNPVLLPEYCRVQGPSSYVCDPDEVLTAEELNHLNHLIRKIASESQCHCSSCAIDKHGVSIGIAIAQSIFQPYNVLPLNNTAEFAEALRRNWKLGICDNDIVILLTTEDRLWYVSYGLKTRRLFPADAPTRIREHNKLAFSNGRYYEGLESMILQIHRELVAVESGEYKAPEPASREANVSTIIGVFLLIVVAVVLVCVLIWLILLSLRKRKQRKHRVQPHLGPEAETLKAAEAMGDQNSDSGWFSSKSNKSSKVLLPSEKRKLRPSSIEESIDEREPDEVDDPVYKETTVPA